MNEVDRMLRLARNQVWDEVIAGHVTRLDEDPKLAWAALAAALRECPEDIRKRWKPRLEALGLPGLVRP